MLPYSFVWKHVVPSVTGSQENAEEKPTESKTQESTDPEKPEKKTLLARVLPGYVYKSWQALEAEDKKEVGRRVLRYYKLLILPIALAIGAIAVRIIRLIRRTASAEKKNKRNCDRFVLLFTVWWLLDMGFVWVSPRSYEQYYLPLNASAAMLGGYLIAAYTELLANPANKNVWRIVGVIGLFVMIGMSWHIFFGIEKSPHSGTSYGAKSRGYVQKFKEVANRRKGAKGYWEIAGKYIRDNSDESDTIYVWGWVPGIYVQAQRLSNVSQAFEGTMHTLSPTALSNRVTEILSAFKKEPPKFIVDTHKRHFPWDRPPLELWPILQRQILQQAGIRTSEPDKAYADWLAKNTEPDEALRYEAMKPFRNYVMSYYTIVQRSFGQNVLFERK
jgi:4-amino-4-deoxy-L-arabinose transferase-like glycosyltransferase